MNFQSVKILNGARCQLLLQFLNVDLEIGMVQHRCNFWGT